MNSAADFVAEDVVDQLVLLYPGQALEALRDDLGAKVVPAAGEVLHGHPGAGKGAGDAVFEFGGLRHVSSGYRRRGRYNLGRW